MQVRTSALEEQAQAAHHVLLLAEALGAHFAPYVERCAGSIAPLAVSRRVIKHESKLNKSNQINFCCCSLSFVIDGLLIRPTYMYQ